MNSREVFTFDTPKIIYQPLSPISAIGQCDACSPIIFAKHEIPQSDLSNVFYNKSSKLIEQAIDSTFHAILSPFTKMFSVLNESALTCLQHFNSPKMLEDIPSYWSEIWGKVTVQSTLEQMIKLGLLMPERYIASPLIETPRTLAAWLHITDRCNLCCDYCYLPHNNTDMSLETGLATIDAVFRSAVIHNYRVVKFKYAGGEPLLRFPFITELHRYAQTLADQHDFLLDGVVLSNGTCLTSEIVTAIQSLDLRLMISLDSLGQSHNQQRIYPNGSDSSNDVIRAIELALDYGLIPDISITVSGRNAKGLPELVAWISERDLPFRLNFYRENDLSSDHADLKLDKDKMIANMLSAYKVVEANLPRYSLLASLVDQTDLSTAHFRTCSVGHSYLVFDYSGRISKCQMQSDQPVTTAQAKDPLALIRTDKNGIQNISVEEKEDCHSCEWKYLCTGGCPLETFRATGRYDRKSSNCPIYRSLYPEVLRLEGLRLLKYASNLVTTTCVH